MASLRHLLAEEGFDRQRSKLPKTQKSPAKFRDNHLPDETIDLPIYVCHDRKSFDNTKKKTDKALPRSGSSLLSLKKAGSDTEISNSKLFKAEVPRRLDHEPAIDEVAIRAVVSILSGYIGRYLKDETFREILREKCYSCLAKTKKVSDNGILAKMELGIESIDKLVEDQGTKKELRMNTLQNSIRLLSIVASLNSRNARNGSTCGIPNSYLSACAQLYLSILYKLEKNDRISASHLLQVFCDSPFLARTRLLTDLWKHFFLPHLLHLKLWYVKELGLLSNSGYSDQREKRMKALSKVYNDQIDMGTSQFALYYKGWLKVGVKGPSVPCVPLPSRPSYGISTRMSSDSFTSSHSSVNRNLYRTIFGPTIELDGQNGALVDTWSVEGQEEVCNHEDNFGRSSYVHSDWGTHQSPSDLIHRNEKAELLPEMQKSGHFRILTCQNEPTECLVKGNHIVRSGSIRKEENVHLLLSDLSRAITTICSSDSLRNCEIAIRVITKTWLDTHADSAVEAALSKPPVIEGMLDVLIASSDNEILELAISILAELVSRNEVNRQGILNSDSQLEIFMELLRNSSLFLKAAVLLYLLKPKGKQMISMEWVPLVLRVLEFGDQLQTLFTVRCSPQVAAFYFLDQLLNGFDKDRNLENARQVVSLGGLSLLLKRIETGDSDERNNATSIIYCCIRADGRCRNYLANNLNKASILELLVPGNQARSTNRSVLFLLTGLLCISRIHVTKLLNGLVNGVGNLNSMHILLVCLQKAPPEERPLVAAILFQLDLLGDGSKCSVYRDEVVEAIIASLDGTTQVINENIQEQLARALLMLGGHFSSTGEPSVEKWLLKRAGLENSSADSFHGKDLVSDEFMNSDTEEVATESWQRRAAFALLTSGKKRFLEALSYSISNGIPCLARASIVTVSWMSIFIPSVEDEILQSTAYSILVPQLLESMKYNKDLEERVLASYSMLSLIKYSDYSSSFSLLDFDNELLSRLQNLSLVTWTAVELISIITCNSRLLQ